MTTTHRARVADFWDSALEDWMAERTPSEELRQWRDSYRGTGAGKVDDSCYPDPYVGDLRGLESEPEVVVLGLNPGVGYPPLQGRDGLWTRRIAEQGYSRCLTRSPAEDPDVWIDHHRGPSVYWRNLIRFSSRWLGRDATVSDILNFELYPWHSSKITGPMNPPVDLVDRYVWKPIEEVPTSVVFAFGTKWFDVCESLQLERIAAWDAGSDELRAGGVESWRLAMYALPSGQVTVVSAQAGYAGPPNEQRTEIIRSLMEERR